MSGQPWDQATATYALPAERAAWLTRAAGINNVARDAQVLAMLAQVEPAIIACFRHGGGVPYAAFPRFHEIMAENSRRVVDATLIRDILPVVPALIARLAEGIDVLEVGCGSGHALNLMAQAFPRTGRGRHRQQLLYRHEALEERKHD